MKDSYPNRLLFLDKKIGSSFVECVERNGINKEDLIKFISDCHFGQKDIVDKIFSECMKNRKFGDLSEQEAKVLFEEVLLFWSHDNYETKKDEDYNKVMILKSLSYNWLQFIGCEVDCKGIDKLLFDDRKIDDFMNSVYESLDD